MRFRSHLLCPVFKSMLKFFRWKIAETFHHFPLFSAFFRFPLLSRKQPLVLHVAARLKCFRYKIICRALLLQTFEAVADAMYYNGATRLQQAT